eukprot:TCONS_00062858-protein
MWELRTIINVILLLVASVSLVDNVAGDRHHHIHQQHWANHQRKLDDKNDIEVDLTPNIIKNNDQYQINVGTNEEDDQLNPGANNNDIEIDITPKFDKNNNIELVPKDTDFESEFDEIYDKTDVENRFPLNDDTEDIVDDLIIQENKQGKRYDSQHKHQKMIAKDDDEINSLYDKGYERYLGQNIQQGHKILSSRDFNKKNRQNLKNRQISRNREGRFYNPTFCFYRTDTETKKTCYGDLCIDVVITKFIQECISI